MGRLEIRLPSAATTTLPLSIGPPAGYKWKLIFARIGLYTGSTAGTRSLGLYQVSGFMGAVAELCNTNSQTGTSTNYLSSFNGQVSTSITPDVPAQVWGAYPGIIIDDDNVLQLLSQDISGDTYQAVIYVEESQ